MVQWFIKGLTEDALAPQLVLVVWLVAPILWGIYTRLFLLRKIDNQYRERLVEKDAQIKRLERRVDALYTRATKEPAPPKPEGETKP